MSTVPDDLASAPKEPSTPHFYLVGLVVFMIAVVLAGFWPTYLEPVLRGDVSEAVSDIRTFPWLIHLHGAVFMSWMALLLVQVTLVARNNTFTHMSVGLYGFVVGLLVLGVGLTLTFLVYQTFVSEGLTWMEVVTGFWFPLVDMVEFSILLAIGYFYRRRPEVHKRMMLFATVALLHAATGVRMDYLLGAWTHEIIFTLEVGLIYGYDLLQERRIHPASLLGTLIVLPDVILWYLPGLGP